MQPVGDPLAWIRRCQNWELYILVGEPEWTSLPAPGAGDSLSRRREEWKRSVRRGWALSKRPQRQQRQPDITWHALEHGKAKWTRGCEEEHLALYREQHARVLAAFDALVASDAAPPPPPLTCRELVAMSREDNLLRAARAFSADLGHLVLEAFRTCRTQCVEAGLFDPAEEGAFAGARAEDPLLVTVEGTDTAMYEKCGWRDQSGAELRDTGESLDPTAALQHALAEATSARKYHLQPGDSCTVKVDFSQGQGQGQGQAVVVVTRWGVTLTRSLCLKDYFARGSAMGLAGAEDVRAEFTLSSTADPTVMVRVCCP